MIGKIACKYLLATFYFEKFNAFYLKPVFSSSNLQMLKEENFYNWKRQHYFYWLILKICFWNYVIVIPPTTNILLNEIAKSISIYPVNNAVFKKNQSQKLLNLYDRKKLKIFASEKNIFTNQKILLLDDICTSGNTIIKCWEIIFQEHPKKLAIGFLYKKMVNI